jgi:hypothetical protein
MPDKDGDDYSDREEVAQLRQLANEVFGLRFGRKAESGLQANFIGIRSAEVSCSARLDSRTYFVQDSRFGVDQSAGVFTGSKKEYVRAGQAILKGLHISKSEIDKADVLQEQSRVASVERERNHVEMEAVQPGKRLARLTRQVENLPVWSSSMMMGLTRKGRVGYLQLHWPVIPAHIVHEAHRLAYQVGHKWSPPELPGSKAEAVQAGIIHSPAIGLLMDIYPVVRVIYAGLEERFGRRAVLYLDRSGKPVPIPRQADLPPERPQERPRSDQKG